MNCRDAWIFLAADSNGWIWMDLHGIPIHVTWISLKTVWLWNALEMEFNAGFNAD